MAAFLRSNRSDATAPRVERGPWLEQKTASPYLDPRRTKRARMRFMPVWHIIFFIYVILVMRIVAMAHVGPVAYQARMDELQTGNLLERSAAKVMYMDPVSKGLAGDVRRSIRSWVAMRTRED